MNRNIALVGGAVALICIVIGLAVYRGNTEGSPSGMATSTPDTSGTAQTATAPIAVTDPTSATSDSAASVFGTVNPKGEPTTYWYEYGRTNSLGTKTPNTSIGSGYASINAPIVIAGLSRDTVYYYRLVAENKLGKTQGTTYTFTTTHSVPAPVGNVPTIQTKAADGITRSAANINGSVVPNGASTTYWFEYGTTQNFGLVTTFESVGDGTATVPASVSLSGLQANTTYHYRLNAQNKFGTVIGTSLSFKTLGPAAPTPAAPTAVTRNATGVNNTSATLRGTVDPNNAATTYWFEYSTDSLLGSVLRKTTAKVSAGSGGTEVQATANISGLARGTTYYVRVVAQNSLGTTEGAKVSFKTK